MHRVCNFLRRPRSLHRSGIDHLLQHRIHVVEGDHTARGLPPDRQPGEGQRNEMEDDDRFDMNEVER